jgi:endonuclease YncB( thermonuclease family)
VIKVSDGDSLQVRQGDKVVRVRLYGIDCPELDQDFGPAAKKFTKAQVFKKKVQVEAVDRDRYGRTVALVWSSGKLLNRELIRAGYAWTYPRYCTNTTLCNEFKTLQNMARQQGQGLWQKKAPQAPWEWRRNKRPPRS